MTARRKQRVLQHIMEDESYKIIKQQIPAEWVVRDFNRPDYGVDLVIELFEKTEGELAETLGEFIYVQVKSISSIPKREITLYDVENVAKGVWTEDKTKSVNIECVTYRYDTNSILTVQALGGSISFLLFLVDISTREVYFVCMNDYIEKIILPKDSNYADRQSVLITIPTLNRLSNKVVTAAALGFYGKRSKLLGAFSKFSYQKNEIAHLLGFKDYPVKTLRDDVEKRVENDIQKIKVQLLYFIAQIEDMDIWRYKYWNVLPLAHADLKSVKNLLQNDRQDWDVLKSMIIILWHHLTNLGTMYEEICREWFLPKKISIELSYPLLKINE
ncbi:MAG: DUF4365 domain-containing protein [Flavipsychrobacter sp.]